MVAADSTPMFAHENPVAELALAAIKSNLSASEYYNLTNMWLAKRGVGFEREGMKLDAASARRYKRFGLVQAMPGERGVYTTSQLGDALAARG